jgi:Ca-activated chloride channel family protein
MSMPRGSVLASALLSLALLLAASVGAQESVEPLIELVPLRATAGETQRVLTLVTSEAIQRVQFRVDGQPVSSDRSFPFTARIDGVHLSAGAVLEVVALDADGEEIAHDSLCIDAARFPTRVDISEIREISSTSWIEVAAQVEHPEAASIERVDFYLGDRFAASTRRSPFRARIPKAEDGSFVRAVAHLPDGTYTEGVRVLSSPEVADATSVHMLEIYAMVNDRRGRPVTDLGLSDFELFDGSRRLAPDRFSIGDDVPLSIGLVIDSSGSMLTAMGDAKDAARLFLDQALDERDRAFLVDFDARPRLLQSLTDDVEGLVSRFDEIRSHGASAVRDAVLFSLLHLEAAPGRKALIVLSDGLDSSSIVSVEDCWTVARRSGVPVFIIALGERLERTPTHQTFSMQRLAERSGGAVYTVSGTDDIARVYRQIDLQLRGQYLLGFSTETALTLDQLDALRLTVAEDHLQVRAILGGQLRTD